MIFWYRFAQEDPIDEVIVIQYQKSGGVGVYKGNLGVQEHNNSTFHTNKVVSASKKVKRMILFGKNFCKTCIHFKVVGDGNEISN